MYTSDINLLSTQIIRDNNHSTHSVIKDCYKERYNTHDKSCNSILYKKQQHHYIGSIFGTMCCLLSKFLLNYKIICFLINYLYDEN